jgi:hypothetical protein
MSECDLAPIERGLRDLLDPLAFDDTDCKTRSLERQRERQAGGTGADHDDVEAAL